MWGERKRIQEKGPPMSVNWKYPSRIWNKRRETDDADRYCSWKMTTVVRSSTYFVLSLFLFVRTRILVRERKRQRESDETSSRAPRFSAIQRRQIGKILSLWIRVKRTKAVLVQAISKPSLSPKPNRKNRQSEEPCQKRTGIHSFSRLQKNTCRNVIHPRRMRRKIYVYIRPSWFAFDRKGKKGRFCTKVKKKKLGGKMVGLGKDCRGTGTEARER